MPTQEVLLLAMTRMRSGICVAGFTPETDPRTRLRWVRPVRDFDTVQAGDMADADGHLYQCSDVVELHLLKPRPTPPHVEDWLTDFSYHPPKLLRRLEGARRADFFCQYLDSAPEDVVIHFTRSLCLVRPCQVCADFALDAYSGKYEARMSFALTTDGPEGTSHILWRTETRGIPVTDLKWCALGRDMLGESGGRLKLQASQICERLGAEALYLALGLSRAWNGKCWPMVVGVHTIPDYDAPTILPTMQ